MSHRPLLIFTCITLFTAIAPADTLITIKGERLEGPSTLSPAGISIAGKTIPLSDLFFYTTTTLAKPQGLQLHLVSGTVLPLRQLQNNHDQRLRAIGIDNTSLDFPITDIAAITFKGAPDLSPDPGALLATGDLFPGTLMHLSDTNAQFQSPLFGLRSFHYRDLTSITLRAITPADAPYTIRLRDGTTSPIAALTLGDNALTFKPHSTLPHRTYAAAEVLSITRSPTFATKVPNQILGSMPVSITLPPNTTALLVNARISPDLLPIAKSRILILSDSTELFRSPPLTSLDDPIQITLPVQGKTTLTFKLDSTLPLAAKAELNEIQLLPAPSTR